MLSDHAALIDYVINRNILICSSEVGFLCRHNAVYSDEILLPVRRVGTKRALSNTLLHDNYLTIRLLRATRDATICLVCIFLVLVKETLY